MPTWLPGITLDTHPLVTSYASDGAGKLTSHSSVVIFSIGSNRLAMSVRFVTGSSATEHVCLSTACPKRQAAKLSSAANLRERESVCVCVCVCMCVRERERESERERGRERE